MFQSGLLMAVFVKHPCVFVILSSPLLLWGLLQSSVVVGITLTGVIVRFLSKLTACSG